MFTRITIQQRILLTFTLIVLVGGVMQFFVAGRQLRQATLEFYQHHLEADALLMAATFVEPLEDYLDDKDKKSLVRHLARLQQEFPHYYLIVDRRYRVIGYTAGAGYEQLDRVERTPELVAASANRMGADIRPNHAGQDTLYVAATILDEKDVLGYLVLSKPMQAAYDEVNQRYVELASTVLPVIGLVIAGGTWIAGTISRPLQRLRNSAIQMASGALDTRIKVTLQDEVGQLATAFNYMAEQLESLLKAQRGFVSNAAHELRTPLMTLKLRAEALAEEALTPAERELYLREMRQELDHMAQLVSSLLTLARIDEGHAQNSAVVSDTVAALHDMLRHWRMEAEKRGLTFAAAVDDTLPELPMSQNDLRLVLDNLLANAVKYTTEGGIRVEATYSQGNLTLVVQDTGLGFTSEQSKHLFERFYRSEQARGKAGGSGLGLSVVKAVLQRHGGTIRAESSGLNQGAVFTVCLPLAHKTG